MFIEVFLVAIYCVQECEIINLDINNVMLHISCVKIIDYSTAFIEYDNGAILVVYIYGWV